jgi:O-antigen ligase
MIQGNNGPMARIVLALAFLFPIFTATIKSWHSGIFAFLILLCLAPAIKHWHLYNRQEKSMVYAFGILIAVSSLSLFNADDLQKGSDRIWRLSYTLGLIPLVLTARRFRLNLTRPFLYGMLAGVLVLGSVAFYQVEYLGWERAMGSTNPVLFGNIALLYGLFGVGLMMTGTVLGRYRWAVAIGILLALNASVLSLSRGGWMALPPILFFLLWLKRERFTYRMLVAGLAGMLLVGGVVLFSAGEQVAERWRVTSQDVRTFVDASDRNTSIGQRLLMWQIAWESFKEHPIIGSGIGDFRHDTLQMMASGETVLDKDYGHSHSIYLEFLGMTGLTGFLAMVVSLFVLPFRYFWRHWQKDPAGGNFPALAGMITILSFAIFGLSDNWCARSITMTVYVFSLYIFWASCPQATAETGGSKRTIMVEDHSVYNS